MIEYNVGMQHVKSIKGIPYYGTTGLGKIMQFV